jgi:hypothetical protein
MFTSIVAVAEALPVQPAIAIGEFVVALSLIA